MALTLTYSLAGATTGTGTAVQVPADVSNLRIDVIGNGTITAGTLVLEEAWSPKYGGTWSALSGPSGAIDLTALTGGKTQTWHFLGNFATVRGRLSANVTGGGSVTVTVSGS
jgi:hypothetical protein